MSGFGELVDDMDETIMSSLNDGAADYIPPPNRGGAVSGLEVSGLEVIIERNLQMVGAEGAFQTTLVGVTWRKRLLPRVDRGGVFNYRSERFLVEKELEDDGEWMTAACKVQP